MPVLFLLRNILLLPQLDDKYVLINFPTFQLKCYQEYSLRSRISYFCFSSMCHDTKSQHICLSFWSSYGFILYRINKPYELVMLSCSSYTDLRLLFLFCLACWKLFPLNIINLRIHASRSSKTTMRFAKVNCAFFFKQI